MWRHTVSLCARAVPHVTLCTYTFYGEIPFCRRYGNENEHLLSRRYCIFDGVAKFTYIFAVTCITDEKVTSENFFLSLYLTVSWISF